MIANYPILMKEFIQSSHRRRTYILRTLLPVAACILLGIRLTIVLAMSGQDWRAIALSAKPLFLTSMWMMLVLFPTLAMTEAQTSLKREWTRKTMDLLCATPISLGNIVIGKLVSALGKVLVMGLALLPVMGIWLHLGRVPAKLVIAAVGVIVSTTFMMAALGMMSAAMTRPGKRLGGIAFRMLIVVYFGGIIILATLVWNRQPVLVAAIPPWAFRYVTSGTAPQGVSFGLFALLAVFLPLGVGGAAMAASARLFRWRYARHIGGSGIASKRRKRLPKWIQGLLGTRPELGPRENPFQWQEKGPPTRLMRWGLFMVYGIVIVVLLLIASFADTHGWEPLEAFSESGFYLFLAGLGAGYVTLAATLYAVNVFAREKVRQTATSLVLTGNHPRRFYRAKIAAAYRALWPAYVALAVCLLFAILTDRGWSSHLQNVVLIISVWAIGGPVSGMIVGLAFSAAARKPADAFAAILLSPVFSWAFMGMFTIPLIFLRGFHWPRVMGFTGGGIAIAAVMTAIIRFTRRWVVWRMMLILSLIPLIFMCVGQAVEEFLPGGADMPDFVGIILAVCIWVATIGFWYWLGVKTFDGCMLQDA